jgi:hypothetical protein
MAKQLTKEIKHADFYTEPEGNGANFVRQLRDTRSAMFEAKPSGERDLPLTAYDRESSSATEVPDTYRRSQCRLDRYSIASLRTRF